MQIKYDHAKVETFTAHLNYGHTYLVAIFYYYLIERLER